MITDAPASTDPQGVITINVGLSSTLTVELTGRDEVRNLTVFLSDADAGNENAVRGLLASVFAADADDAHSARARSSGSAGRGRCTVCRPPKRRMWEST